ncbi:unnamed protein product [Caenorhabditis nigoni]
MELEKHLKEKHFMIQLQQNAEAMLQRMADNVKDVRLRNSEINIVNVSRFPVCTQILAHHQHQMDQVEKNHYEENEIEDFIQAFSSE